MKKTDKLTIKERIFVVLVAILIIFAVLLITNFLIEVPRQLHELNEILRELKL